MNRLTMSAAIAALFSLPLAAHAAGGGGGVTDFGQPGTMEAGGTVSIVSGSTSDKPKGGSSTTTSTTDIELHPLFGYFLMDNVELLGGLDIGNSSQSVSGGGGKTSSSAIGLNVGAGYYMGVGDGGLRVGPDLRLGFTSFSDDLGGGTKLSGSGPQVLIGGTFKAPMGKEQGAVLNVGLHYAYANDSLTIKSGGGSASGTATVGDIILDAGFTFFFK